MKEYYRKPLEEEVKTALHTLSNLGNLTLMIEGNKMKNGILEKNDCEEMKIDLEWRDALNKAFDVIFDFAEKYGFVDKL